MRFIDLEDVRPLIRHLLTDLDEAKNAVAAEADPKKRSDLVEALRKRWVALRPYLEEVSYKKCWYVECRNPGTDDDVDHFRPKGRVHEDPNHLGYYWLAFDWTNYRLSCHRANRWRINQESGIRGGKADHFPLIDAGTRAFSPEDDISLEVPALIDPTDPLDPPLLTFLPNGEVGLAPERKGDPIAEAKFDASRIHLHLDWPEFVDARVMLFNRVERAIQRGQREAPQDFASASSGGCAPAFKDAIKDLRRMMRPWEEYSMAARAYVESFKHLWWVRDIVLGNGV